MLNYDQLKSELSTFTPNLEEFTLLNFKGFHYSSKTPRHHFDIFDFFVEDLGFLHITARNSFNETILNWLIKSFQDNRNKKYHQDYLHVMRAYDLRTFDTIGLCPPPIAEIYKSQSSILAKSGYWLFPMYGIEFLHKYSAENFCTQIKRRDKWKVEIVDWDREINIIRGKNTEAPAI